MKIIFIFFIFFTINKISAQYKYNTCEEAKLEAIEDVKSGILKSFDYGRPDVPEDWNPEFEEYYEIFMFSKFGIEIANQGCIVFDNELCYSKFMDSIITSKFGSDFFEKNRTQLKNKFSSLTYKNKIETLDFNKVYRYNFESFPKFIGNDRIIKDYLNSIIERKDKNLLTDIVLIIERNGKIIEIKLKKGLNWKIPTSKKEIIEKLNKLGKWEPAYIYGQQVKSEMEFFIY